MPEILAVFLAYIYGITTGIIVFLLFELKNKRNLTGPPEIKGVKRQEDNFIESIKNMRKSEGKLSNTNNKNSLDHNAINNLLKFGEENDNENMANYTNKRPYNKL